MGNFPLRCACKADIVRAELLTLRCASGATEYVLLEANHSSLKRSIAVV